MTVKKLIELLKKCDPDASVKFADGFYSKDGYAIGRVTQRTKKDRGRTIVSLYRP